MSIQHYVCCLLLINISITPADCNKNEVPVLYGVVLGKAGTIVWKSLRFEIGNPKRVANTDSKRVPLISI